MDNLQGLPLDGKTSFLMGYNYGSQGQSTELSAREIVCSRPEVDLDSFAQGMLDGLVGDRYRVDLICGQWPLF